MRMIIIYIICHAINCDVFLKIKMTFPELKLTIIGVLCCHVYSQGVNGLTALRFYLRLIFIAAIVVACFDETNSI